MIQMLLHSIAGCSIRRWISATQNSNNYFLSPQGKVSGWTFGVSPSITAEWSNGIHSTVLYGNYQHVEYPTNNALITNDGETTFTQKYAPLRDLTFSFLGDYTHKTLANSLTNAIPSPITSTGTIVLPNGNIVLPNGTIVSPTGQVVGQISSALNVNTQALVNPFDQYTGTARVEKVFNDGILTLGTSIQRVNYEEQASENLDYTAKAFTEDGAVWLGPVFYAYTDGTYSTRANTSPNPDTSAYNFVGGIGTRQIDWFRASAYFGHQGSGTSGQGSAGGNVYGGRLTFYPSDDWTITANIGRIINIAPSQASASTQALSLPGTTPLQISVSSSTEITATSLQVDYRITPQWLASGTFGYTHIQYIGSPSLTNTWLADASLKYEIWRNMTLKWEYQYSSIVSNIAFTTAVRNLVSMGASYKF